MSASDIDGDGDDDEDDGKDAKHENSPDHRSYGVLDNRHLAS